MPAHFLPSSTDSADHRPVLLRRVRPGAEYAAGTGGHFGPFGARCRCSGVVGHDWDMVEAETDRVAIPKSQLIAISRLLWDIGSQGGN